MKGTERFVPAGEVVANERAQIAFSNFGVHQNDRYAIAISDEGKILLTPIASIPERELLVWENSAIHEDLVTGLRQSAEGETEDLGDFTQFAEGDGND